MPDAGLHSLREFAAVINRCAVLVSSDSLAMHFGVALNKRLVVFFGPTSAAEIELYGLGEKLTAPLECTAAPGKASGESGRAWSNHFRRFNKAAG